MKFADCLLQLTDPRKILHFLEKKAIRFLGQSFGTEPDDEWYDIEEAIKEQVDRFLSLYESGPAYFYFLDEYTGVPVVPERSNIYPLAIRDAVDMVRKVLPLMLTGMILMRGEKAVSVVAKVVSDKNVSIVQKHWVEAAKDITGYLFSPHTEWTNTYLQDLLPLRDDLIDLVDRRPCDDSLTRDSGSISSEWVVELSLVRMMVEMHDSKHTYAGLRPRRAGKRILWTRDPAFLDQQSPDHLFRYDFKSIVELKELAAEQDEDAVQVLESDVEHEVIFRNGSMSSRDSWEERDAYGLLFSDLALYVRSNSEENTPQALPETKQPLSLDLGPSPDFVPPVPRRSRYASEAEPISLLSFDETMDLDDVLQLRIQFDEQEAKLDFLKDKIASIHESEMELLEDEEELGRMLSELNKGSSMLNTPESSGLSSARKLLLRICNLEERVLCREIEVQQLKLDISVFEIETDNDGFEHLPDVINFSLS
jgi:hypothetical protein